MNKLLIALVSLLLSTSTIASDAKLKMKISGPIADNRYFLCVSHVGCVSILNGNKGKVYPMNQGPINNIMMVNIGDRRIHPQQMPDSCNVSVQPEQTVMMSGKLVKEADKVVIKNLRCAVS